MNEHGCSWQEIIEWDAEHADGPELSCRVGKDLKDKAMNLKKALYE